MKPLKDQVSHISRPVCDQVRNLRYKVDIQIWNQVGDQVGFQVWNEVRNPVWDKILDQVLKKNEWL